MFPEDLVELLKIRLKNQKEYEEKLSFIPLEKVMRRINLLLKTAEIATEKGRSGLLSSQSCFLISAREIVRSREDSLFRQAALEALCLYYERNFIGEMLKDLNRDNADAPMQMMFGLFNKCLPNIIEAIKAVIIKAEMNGLEELKSGKVLDGRVKLLMALYILGPETVASIVFSHMVRISGPGGGEEMDLINKISEAIFVTIKHKRKINHKLPKAVKVIWPARRDEVIQLSALDKVVVGQCLIDICLQCCPKLFEKMSRMVSPKERVNWIVIKKEFTTFMTNFAFNPIRLPMLHKPMVWSLDDGLGSGGYIHELYNELVNSKGLVHHEVSTQIRSVIGEDQINAVNYLNAQKFEINEDMLDFLLEDWEKDDSLIFEKYNKPCQDEIFNEDTQRHNSLYWMYRNILNIAQLFRGEVFYLPVFMDFRGRIYPLVNYLTYQGGDVARSLLNFQRTKYSGKNNNHILIYLCNVFGLNKLSMKNRIVWAREHIPNMLDLYENNREKFYEVYLCNAKEKAQFMSCALEIFKALWLYGGDYSQCKLPVLFDATCSGMQHLSALTTNLDLAVLVNLTGADLKDFYSHCGEMVSKVIADFPEDDIREKLLKIKIDRKLVKLPVMTIPYNIGLEGLTEKITDNFQKSFVEENGVKKLWFLVPAELTIDGKELMITGKIAGKLGSIIYHTVKAMMPPIQPLKDYFARVLKVLAKLNKPIFWITPAGMTIWGSSLVTTTKRVKTSFVKNSQPVTIRIPSENYDYKVINRSLMANFIHSMDAANIHYLIKLIISNPELRNLGISLYTIHDCFASVNDQMDIMEKLVRQAFSQLYFEKNYLVELDRCLISQIKSYGVEIQKSKDGERLAVFQTRKPDGKLETLEVPRLPDFNWEVNKDYLKKQIILAEYFIS
jgi:DNA-directed RNA polymerase